MNDLLKKIGIRDESFELLTVRQLIAQKVLEKPLDGNHGEIHPKGEDFVAEGVPFIMATDVNDGQVDYTTCKFITAKQADSLRKGFARNGDVLVTHKATIGRTAIVKYDKHPYVMLTPQVTYYRVKDRRRLDNRYLRHYFDSELFQKTLHLWADSGSTRAYLGITEQQKLPIIIPPIRKQRKIAAMLSAYDELIENNNRRIALLEKMAEEIYREWFVRLRFPGHKKVKLVKGVPQEWAIEKLGSILELCYGRALKEDDRIPGEFPVYGSSGVVGTHNEALVKTPGLIVGRKGNVGSIHYSERPFFPIDTVYFVKSKLPNSFLRFLLRSMNFINNDAAVPGLNRKQAYSNQFFLPRTRLIEKFAELADPLFEMSHILARQSEKLTTTRDQVLPRLISGKLSVENLDIHFPPSMAEELNAGPTATAHA